MLRVPSAARGRKPKRRRRKNSRKTAIIAASSLGGTAVLGLILFFAIDWGGLSGSRQNLESALPSVVLKGHTDEVWKLAISPDGRWLVTGSADQTARLWDLKRL